MKIVIGLGNIGEKYDETRHNVGFVAVDRLYGDRKFLSDKKFKAMVGRIGDVVVAKPETFMNLSGDSVVALANFYKVERNDIWVIHDDLDIRLGEYKIQKGVGPKDHNGVNDIEEKLRGGEFWRVRIGVDSREDRGVPGEKYVLMKLGDEEKVVLDRVVDDVVDKLRTELGLSD